MFGLLSKRKHRVQRNICSVIVVAAGSARRMEGIDKVMAPLEGIPVLARTLMVFQQCPDVHEIVVVTREDLLEEIGDMCKAYNLDKVSGAVVGGAERVLSVQAGLLQVRQDAELIAIHDGARPFLSQAVLATVLRQARRSGAAAPAIAVNDTIKRVNDSELVTDTVDRGCLRAVQTPQVFQADLIRAAIEKAVADGAAVTDDCSAVERLGIGVVLTPGERENIKITTPFDMKLGQAILESRGE